MSEKTRGDVALEGAYPGRGSVVASPEESDYQGRRRPISGGTGSTTSADRLTGQEV
jgi:hypothetical protein